MFQVPTNTVIMSGSGFCECLFFICWSSWQKPSLFWRDIKQKTYISWHIAHFNPLPKFHKIFALFIHFFHLISFFFLINGKLLRCLLPLCSQTQTLCAGSSLSLSPGWVWCVLSETSPAAELKKKKNQCLCFLKRSSSKISMSNTKLACPANSC